jgi:arylsulfatase
VGRSYTITADVEVSKEGAEGVLNASGGRFAGYGLYLLKGKPVFTYNLADFTRFKWEGKEALPPGKHTIAFDFTYEGPGFAKGGTGVLKVDGKEVDTRKFPHTLPIILQWEESFDVGSDSGTPVDDRDYQVPFAFTGKLNGLTVKLGPSQLPPAERKAVEKKISERD